MEASLLENLHLLDGREAGRAEDEARVRTSRNFPAHVLVLVDELHPHAVEVLERDLVPGGPVVPVGAVIGTTRLVIRVE